MTVACHPPSTPGCLTRPAANHTGALTTTTCSSISGQCKPKVSSSAGGLAWSQDHYWPPAQLDEVLHRPAHLTMARQFGHRLFPFPTVPHATSRTKSRVAHFVWLNDDTKRTACSRDLASCSRSPFSHFGSLLEDVRRRYCTESFPCARAGIGIPEREMDSSFSCGPGCLCLRIG